MDFAARSTDPRRDGARILDTAEGVLVAWRGCSLDAAFVEIVHTAKHHNVGTMTMADALVAVAQTHAPRDVDDTAYAAARAAWGELADRSRPAPPPLDEDDPDDDLAQSTRTPMGR
ncbi:ANTAR domain-containing protein [Mycolicibacterium boenickei]|nr:ANTAR domain-containing protein [Mycolicibacterium boenickei]